MAKNTNTKPANDRLDAFVVEEFEVNGEKNQAGQKLAPAGPMQTAKASGWFSRRCRWME